MDHLPDTIPHSLLENGEVEVSDWVKNAISSATLIEVFDHERTLAKKLIKSAYASTANIQYTIGIALAAAFDLFVAAEYYKSVAHKGWSYCPIGEPLLFYPYTNTCPRCVLHGNFHFSQANKPESGSIGQATSRLLGVFLLELFARENRNLIVYRGAEPIDMIIYEESTKTVLLSEIKAAPLQTLALAVSSEHLTEAQEDGSVVPINMHVSSDNISLSSSELYMCLPLRSEGQINYELISLGSVNKTEDGTWAYKCIEQALDRDNSVFERYLEFWSAAFAAYRSNNAQKDNVYWLTNACGQPSPRPRDWPQRRRGSGGGFESVSDGKTSVGMDRTDDIKKGIYQVLKVGAESKPQSTEFVVKTALVSNIHAARHYKEYLTSLEDIVWTIDKSGKARRVADLPLETRVYNLFDGIISFTESHIRDEWLQQIFTF
ncbi:MAG TPA: hypothetical protein VFU49_06495 [Ktedonobacteraceae bacterium]|nr:hypothetical protein [Ktedonobacteraceae bacterium]